MSYVFSTPEPRIVLKKNGVVIDDYSLSGFEGGDDAPQYLNCPPVMLQHKIQGGEIRTKLKGFRLSCEVFWKYVDPDELKKLRKLYQAGVYDQLLLYPYRNDKPFWFEEMSLDPDSDVQIAFHYLLAQRDFTMKLVSKNRISYVPMDDADFLNWGNITLQFEDLKTLPFSSYTKTVTMVKSGGAGTVTGAVANNYWKDGATETLGGSKSTSSTTTFQTDLTTTVMLTASGGTFVKWQVDGVDAGTQPVLNIAVMANVTVTAVFS